MKEAAGWVTGAAFCVLGFVLFIGVISCAVNAASLPSELAEIEQLRADAAVVDPVQAEDVIGQVTEWNQKIGGTKAMNGLWWAGWTIPDEWDGVELIPVPS